MMKGFVALCMILISTIANADIPQVMKDLQLEHAVSAGDVSKVRSAIDDGAENVAVVLERELFKAKRNICYVNFDVIKVLLDLQEQLLTIEQTDNLIYRAIYYGCVPDNDCSLDKIKPSDAKMILGISSWHYEASEKTLEKIASIAANHDDTADVIKCVFEQVSKNKLAGVEFLDIAGRVAAAHNADNMTAFINNLRTIIDNMQDGR